MTEVSDKTVEAGGNVLYRMLHQGTEIRLLISILLTMLKLKLPFQMVRLEIQYHTNLMFIQFLQQLQILISIKFQVPERLHR